MLRDRTKYIGSTDAATILGLNPYQTKLELYNAKINGEVIEETEVMKWGKLLEPVILKEYCRLNNIQAWCEQNFEAHPEYKFIGGTADALTVPDLIEVKTTNEFSHRKWTESLPEHIQIQVQFLMGIHGRQSAKIVVLVAGQKMRVYDLKFDQEIYDMIIAACVNFWNEHIKFHIPPKEEIEE